jgi:hypothetical protein
MSEQQINVLSLHNSHSRDENIKFYEKGHKYEILTDTSIKYTSVTTWIHSHFPKFDADAIIANMMKSKKWAPGHKYWGMTAEEIKSSWNSNGATQAGAGTDLHFQIECFMNNETIDKDYTHMELFNDYSQKKDDVNRGVEWEFFLQFVKDFPDLKPYRTEWMIYNEDIQIAGSIDMVYENPDGTLSIYDWKRCKNISKKNNWNQYATNDIIGNLPATNYWQYALQLNLYKKILEDKYGKIVTKLCLVRIHPDNLDKTYELIKLPILEKEMNNLIEERKNILSYI